MTLVQLRHMIDLANTGSFVKSAENLFITQPALSRSIQLLEEELGGKLFDRQGRHSSLTVLGETIFKRGQVLLDLAKDIQETNHKLKKGLSGQLKIGMGSGPGAMLMTPLLQHVAIHYPHLHLEIIRGSTEMLVDSLRSRKLDAIVIDARSLKPAADLHLEIVCETPGAFLCKKNHPLTLQKKITINDLRQYPIASTPLSDEIEHLLIERYGTQANLADLINIKCTEISSLVEVVNHSETVLLSIKKAAKNLQELKLTPALNATARFGFVTVANRSKSPLLAHIREFIISHLTS